MAELQAPGDSHREKGFTRHSSKDKDWDETLLRTSLSYMGFRFWPRTWTVMKQWKDKTFQMRAESSKSCISVACTFPTFSM